jgi:Tol biopolymer transport system component
MIGVDGRNIRRVSPPGTYSYEPVWSPDGTSIAYATFDDLAVARVVVAGTTRLARPRVVAEFQDERDPPFIYLSWSPDSRSVLFVDSQAGVIAAGAARGGSHVLVAGGTQPTWSPNGRHLAFVAASGELTVADPDGTNPHAIARGAFPAWSPDSTRIAYTSPSGTGLHVTHADGTGDRLVDRKGRFPRWLSNKSLVDANGVVRVVDLRSGRVRVVSNDSSRFFGSDDVEATASGRTIAFTSTPRVGGGEIRLVGVDGRSERRLTYHCALVDESAGGRVYGTWLGDVVLARNNLRDLVFCGPGHDVAYVDRRDRVARDCERVRRR